MTSARDSDAVGDHQSAALERFQAGCNRYLCRADEHLRHRPPYRGRALARMVDPLGVAGTALDVAPQAARAFNVIVGKGSVAKLRGFVACDLRGAHEIPARRHKPVADVWESQGIDPDLNRALTSWLTSGDASFVSDAMTCWRVIISDRDLALDGDEPDAVVTVTTASLRRNFARAQPDEIAAIHAEAERILHAIDGSAGAKPSSPSSCVPCRRRWSRAQAGAL